MKNLADLKVGDKAKVVSINDNDIMLRLMEMGLLPGEDIAVELIAPLGDPIAISVSNYQLSIRKSDAKFVLIEQH